MHIVFPLNPLYSNSSIYDVCAVVGDLRGKRLVYKYPNAVCLITQFFLKTPPFWDRCAQNISPELVMKSLGIHGQFCHTHSLLLL